MNLIIAIDDTDDIGTLGTGEILENLCNELYKEYKISYSGITRHQLLIHQDIKYTSHNSSMCCLVRAEKDDTQSIIEFSQKYLQQESAANSDPGLCVAVKDDLSAEDVSELINWGKLAKNQVLSKEQAYSLANQLKIHLSEHGGSGDGVIGALAGVGLRLSGNDGRFKGKFNLDIVNDFISVEQLLVSPLIEKVINENKQELAGDEKVFITDKIKTVLVNHCAVLPVKRYTADSWINISRKELKEHQGY